MNYQTLDYSRNWNAKLFCPVYSSIRLSGRLNVGDWVEVTLNDRKHHYEQVISKLPMTIGELTDAICYPDTGKNRMQTIQIMEGMYSKTMTDSHPMYLYHFRKENDKEASERLLSNQTTLFA